MRLYEAEFVIAIFDHVVVRKRELALHGVTAELDVQAHDGELRG